MHAYRLGMRTFHLVSLGSTRGPARGPVGPVGAAPSRHMSEASGGEGGKPPRPFGSCPPPAKPARDPCPAPAKPAEGAGAVEGPPSRCPPPSRCASEPSPPFCGTPACPPPVKAAPEPCPPPPPTPAPCPPPCPPPAKAACPPPPKEPCPPTPAPCHPCLPATTPVCPPPCRPSFQPTCPPVPVCPPPPPDVRRLCIPETCPQPRFSAWRRSAHFLGLTVKAAIVLGLVAWSNEEGLWEDHAGTARLYGRAAVAVADAAHLDLKLPHGQMPEVPVVHEITCAVLTLWNQGVECAFSAVLLLPNLIRKLNVEGDSTEDKKNEN